ncbi:MAG: sigma factor [Agathobacter sp.]|nr:sigma factor [Agathobacter sp.]
MQKVDEIYQKYARTVYKYLLSKTHDENLAEELTQETFYQALRCIDRYDGSCKISTWLCAIAKNQSAKQIMMMRRKLIS